MPSTNSTAHTAGRKHLLVLTDAQARTAAKAISLEVQDGYPAEKVLDVLNRQMTEGLSRREITWAMREIVRLDRAAIAAAKGGAV